jgi:hypothetical protein
MDKTTTLLTIGNAMHAPVNESKSWDLSNKQMTVPIYSSRNKLLTIVTNIIKF